ncbi:2426_t:CDS:2, partial [Entrophospora sp. SA101]
KLNISENKEKELNQKVEVLEAEDAIYEKQIPNSFLKILDKGINELTPEEINNFNSNDSDEENNENDADLN